MATSSLEGGDPLWRFGFIHRDADSVIGYVFCYHLLVTVDSQADLVRARLKTESGNNLCLISVPCVFHGKDGISQLYMIPSIERLTPQMSGPPTEGTAS